jgi:signal transduction histidine kinase
MKSIRRRLTGWFLAGLAVLWLGASASVYWSYRSGLMAGMESELQTLCRQVRSSGSAGGGGGGPGRGGPGWGGPPMVSEQELTEVLGPDVYWQIWQVTGDESTRSPNLSGNLPQTDEGRAELIMLNDGTKVMSTGHQYGMGRGGQFVSVAKPLDEVNDKVAQLLVTLVLTGLGIAVVAWLWVRFVVKDGLTPLRRIADEMEKIDVASLHDHFDDRGLPVELQPIVSRLNELMARMEASFTRERRFSADLAHEMRTPIAEAKMIAETAVKWPDEGGPDAWKDVVASVERMESVVQSMLQLARIERESPQNTGTVFPLRLLIEERWSDHAKLAASRGVSLQIDTSMERTLEGDRAWWGHLLGNLLGNAAEYADEGSEVVVAEGDDKTIVSVRNRASGLDENAVTHLFERFWRADQVRGESEHSGLGLALAQACAEAMGLRIEPIIRPDSILEMRVLRQ